MPHPPPHVIRHLRKLRKEKIALHKRLREISAITRLAQSAGRDERSKGIRNLAQQCRTHGEVLIRQLVELDIDWKFRALIAGVSGVDQHVARRLALYVEVELLSIGRAIVPHDSLKILAKLRP